MATTPPKEAKPKVVCTKQVVFSETIQALQGLEMEEPCPLTGEITEVTMHFPDGCNGLVGLQFGHGGVCMFPSQKTQVIALNNSTPTFRNLKESVEKGERLWAILRNADAANPHKPSIIVNINGVE
jgi:hypothetical protein